jgi:glycosyltransferase involved in cell wall biosynthesis
MCRRNAKLLPQKFITCIDSYTPIILTPDGFAPIIFKESVVISGIMYNCETYVDKILENMQIIGNCFSWFKIIIVADAGTDRTFDLLDKWQQKLSDKLIVIKGSKSSKYRTENISIARNKVLKRARKLETQKSFDFFIVMDCDDVCSTEINLDVLKDVIAKKEIWDSVSFPMNTSETYYDIWALSIPPFLISYLHFEDEDAAHKYLHDTILEKLKNDSEDWIPVSSAFGGFAIYKRWFIHLNYDWKISETLKFLSPKEIEDNLSATQMQIDPTRYHGMDCEHRFFHFSALYIHGARMFIYPKNLFKLDKYESDSKWIQKD